MKSNSQNLLFQAVLLAVFSLAFLGDVSAHGESDWNDFKVDNKNNSVEAHIQHVRQLISDIVLGRREISRWPDRELLRARDELVHLKEEMDDMLNHFTEDGVHLQLTDSLRSNPRAGRSVAASHAVEICVELIEHIASLDGPAAFEEELHTGGKGLYMFDLMDSYADQMGLYAELIKKTD